MAGRREGLYILLVSFSATLLMSEPANWAPVLRRKKYIEMFVFRLNLKHLLACLTDPSL